MTEAEAASVGRLSAEVERLKTISETATAEVGTLQKANDELEAALVKEKTARSDAEKGSVKLKERLKRAIGAVEAANAHVTELKATTQAAEENAAKATEAAATAQAEATKYREEAAELSKELRTAASAAAEATSAATQATSESRSVGRELELMEEKSSRLAREGADASARLEVAPNCIDLGV